MRIAYKISVALVFLLSMFGCSHTEPDASAVWIDVRTSDEFSTGHHPDAVNIPHDQIVERIASVTEDKNAAIHLYCRSGRRSGLAKQMLESMGYTNVTNFGGVNQVMELVKKAEATTKAE